MKTAITISTHLALCLLVATPMMLMADGLGDRLPPLAQVSKTNERGDDADQRRDQAQQPRDRPLPPDDLSPAEAKAWKFVREHQPRLLQLLEFLRERQPAQYQQALKEMLRSQQRLESLARRDSELHAVELQLWQTRSELRLLAAEMSVTQGEEKLQRLEQRLEKLVATEADQEVSRLELLKSRTEKELVRLNKQLTDRQERDEVVAKNIKLWQSKIARQVRSQKTK